MDQTWLIKSDYLYLSRSDDIGKGFSWAASAKEARKFPSKAAAFYALFAIGQNQTPGSSPRIVRFRRKTEIRETLNSLRKHLSIAITTGPDPSHPDYLQVSLKLDGQEISSARLNRPSEER